MPIKFRKYGQIVEFTEYEKKPQQVRLRGTRRDRSDVFEPRRFDNIRRTRTICVRRVLSAIEEIGVPLLVTLTFAGDATDAYRSGVLLRRFNLRLRSKYKSAHTLFVPELSPRGRIHFHGLLFGLPLPWGDVYQGKTLLSPGTERRTRILAGIWSQGFVDCRQTDGNPRLAYYISKYISKGAGEGLFQGMRLVRTTKGFPKPFETDGGEHILPFFLNKTPYDTWSIDHKYLGHIQRTRYML